MDEVTGRMRVLVTTPDLDVPGGVSNYFSVLRPLLEQVAEYHFTGLRPNESSPAKVALRLVNDYARFALKLLRTRYDLVHINTAFARKAFPRDAVFCLLAKALRRPILVFVRGGDPGCLQRGWSRWFRLAYGSADGFIVLAKDHAVKLRELGYAGRIDCETTVASPEAFSSIPDRRAGSTKRFRILFLARLEREKGIYEAIEAYRIVKQRHQAAELVIAGGGAESEGARRYVREYAIPDVRFLGHVTGNSKAEAFASGDVYLFPSHFEGMPNSVLEAMAHGLPLVTRRVGGIIDFFEDGAMGFSTDSADAAVFAELIERLIANPELAARMGENNRIYAEHRFAAPVVAKRLLGIYSDLIGQAIRTGVQ